LIECYEREILPSEHTDLAWSRPGALIDLKKRNGEAHAAAAAARTPVAVTIHPAVSSASAVARTLPSAELL